MQCEFCRDFVATKVGDWRYDRAACRVMSRHAERWRAGDRERDRLCSPHARTIDAAVGGRHHDRVVVSPRCSIWLVVFLRPALCRCERVRKSGPAQPTVPLYVPLAQRPGRRLCVRACTHRPQQQQQQQQTRTPPAVASCPWIRAMPLACSSGQTTCLQSAGRVLLQISHSSRSPTLSGNVKTVVITMLIRKYSLHFRTEWDPPVPHCPEM